MGTSNDFISFERIDLIPPTKIFSVLFLVSVLRPSKGNLFFYNYLVPSHLGNPDYFLKTTGYFYILCFY